MNQHDKETKIKSNVSNSIENKSINNVNINRSTILNAKSNNFTDKVVNLDINLKLENEVDISFKNTFNEDVDLLLDDINEEIDEPDQSKQLNVNKDYNNDKDTDDSNITPNKHENLKPNIQQNKFNNNHKKNFNNSNKNIIPNKLKKQKTGEIINSTTSEGVKKVASEGVKKVASEGAKKATASTIGKVVLTNPYILIGVSVILVFFLLSVFIIIFIDGELNDQNGTKGLGYVDVAGTNILYSVQKNGTIVDSGITLNDAVAVILYSEVGIFKDEPELLKAQAVAIRSYVLYNYSDGVINGSQIAYAYDSKDIALATDSVFKQAVQATNGEILTKNGKVSGGYFAAMCYYATTTDATGKQVYQIHYGGESFLQDDSRIQEIPKENLDSYNPSSSWFTSYCYGNHAEGMSQYGAYYLAKELNYEYDEILSYYYFNNELSSYLQGGSYENFTQSSIADGILNTPLSTFLKNNGSSLSEYNNYIYETAVNAGVGTREAAVAVALTYISYMQENYNIRFPYTYSGGNGGWSGYEGIGKTVNTYYGADPDWGTTYSSTFVYSSSTGSYYAFGLDCSAFVTWALKNAGFKQSTTVSGDYGALGTNYSLFSGTAPNYEILPGDLVWQSGHIMMVVGTDLSNNLIYIAHATSSHNKSAVVEGISVTSSSSRYVVSMENFYNTKAAYTEDEFKSVFFNGTLG